MDFGWMDLNYLMLLTQFYNTYKKITNPAKAGQRTVDLQTKAFLITWKWFTHASVGTHLWHLWGHALRTHTMPSDLDVHFLRPNPQFCTSRSICQRISSPHYIRLFYLSRKKAFTFVRFRPKSYAFLYWSRVMVLSSWSEFIMWSEFTFSSWCEFIMTREFVLSRRCAFRMSREFV